MAENTETELKEAKTLLQRMTAFLSGQSTELAEEASGEVSLMALEVGEYTLPDGRKLVVTAEGAEIEMPAEETEEPEMKKEEAEKTEMSAQEPTEVKEEAETVELSAEKVEQVVELAEQQKAKIAELEAKLEEATKAEPLTGAPTNTQLSAQQPKQINHLTQNAWEQSLARLHNNRLKNN